MNILTLQLACEGACFAAFTSLPWDFVAVQNYRKNLFAGASSSQHCDKVGGGAPLLQRERDRQREETEEEEERKGRICAFYVKIETGIRIVRKWWYKSRGRRRFEQGSFSVCEGNNNSVKRKRRE